MSKEHEQARRGERAKYLIESLKDIFASLQMDYVAECATAAKSGQDANLPAMKLAVLDDVVETIIQEITTGKKAQSKIDKRAESASAEGRGG